MEKALAPPIRPLRNQSEDSGEDLWSRGQAEVQCLEMIDVSLEAKVQIQASRVAKIVDLLLFTSNWHHRHWII